MTRAERIARLCRQLVTAGRVRRADCNQSVGGRQADEDLELIKRVWDLSPVGEGRNTEWVLAPSTVRAAGIVDRIALTLGRDLAAFLRETPLHGALDRAAEDPTKGLRRYRNVERKFYFLSEPAREYAGQDEVLWEVLDALLRDRLLKVSYAGSCYPRFHALSLVIYRRALYLFGVAEAEEVVLAVDRIEFAEALDEAVDYPSSWDPAEHFRGAFGIAPTGVPEWVVLRFDEKGARYVRERSFHSTQHLADLPDGGVELRFKASGLELPRFVLEWGPRCRVIEPEWLREEVRRQLAAALRQYEQPSATEGCS